MASWLFRCLRVFRAPQPPQADSNDDRDPSNHEEVRVEEVEDDCCQPERATKDECCNNGDDHDHDKYRHEPVDEKPPHGLPLPLMAERREHGPVQTVYQGPSLTSCCLVGFDPQLVRCSGRTLQAWRRCVTSVLLTETAVVEFRGRSVIFGAVIVE